MRGEKMRALARLEDQSQDIYHECSQISDDFSEEALELILDGKPERGFTESEKKRIKKLITQMQTTLKSTQELLNVA